MKNPNGYGTVYKLSGNRRRPFAVNITEGWTAEGKRVRRNIGYYATRAEALKALAAYNVSPEEFSKSATFAQIYEGWHADKFFGEYRENTEKGYARAFVQGKQFHNKAFTSIKLADLQQFCDNLPNHNQAYRFKSLVAQMSEWAILREYATRNYAEGVEIKQKLEREERTPFTKEEIQLVFQHDTTAALITQVLIYTGLRISELLDMKREDCHLDEHYLYIRKSKTNNGIRIVPIHDKIYDTVATFYNQGKPYVFTTTAGNHFTYGNWAKQYFLPFMRDIGLEHTSHETRHTFISLAAVTPGINQTIIKKIVGHSTAESLTERVYTHISVEDLLTEINKIE